MSSNVIDLNHPDICNAIVYQLPVVIMDESVQIILVGFLGIGLIMYLLIILYNS